QMEQIGFIGLGTMGKPMAKHLLKAGYQVLILKASAAADELAAEGAIRFETPGVLAAQADVVITMLPDSPQVIEIVKGNNGVLGSIRRGSLFIDMSTIAPSVSIDLHKAFQEKGVEALDAPVSGGQTGAEAGTLSIMVGGSENAFEKAR